MLDSWFPQVTFPVSPETFRRFPRHPAYEYEYWDGEAHLSARPKYHHCLLTLTRREVARKLVLAGERPVRFRGVVEADWPDLAQLFASAFDRMPPFALLEETQRLAAAQECLHHTRTGGEGPLVERASFVARTSGQQQLVGAMLVTLSPAGNLDDFGDDTWRDSAPDDPLAQRWGRPHLTWVFVDPAYARYGLGGALLGHAGNALLDLGYGQLASTFLLGNDAAALWHWRQGFQLAGHAASPQAVRLRTSRPIGEGDANRKGDTTREGEAPAEPRI